MNSISERISVNVTSTIIEKTKLVNWSDLSSPVASDNSQFNTNKPISKPATSSGCRSLDACFLRPSIESGTSMQLSGFPTHSVIEIVGESGSGKTQLCFSTAVASAWLGSRVLVFDTSKSFTNTTDSISHLNELIKKIRRSTYPMKDDAAEFEFHGYENLKEGDLACNEHDSMENPASLAALDRISMIAVNDPWTLLRTLSTLMVDTNIMEKSNIMVKECPFDVIIIDGLSNLILPYLDISIPLCSHNNCNIESIVTINAVSREVVDTTVGESKEENMRVECDQLLVNGLQKEPQKEFVNGTGTAILPSIQMPRKQFGKSGVTHLTMEPLVARIGFLLRKLRQKGCTVIITTLSRTSSGELIGTLTPMSFTLVNRI